MGKIGDWRFAMNIEELWTALHARWYGEAADAFWQNYVFELQKNADDFESACAELGQQVENLSEKLQQFEREIN